MDIFCLKRNDFKDSITTSFKDLRENSDFSDVTLICEDNHQVEAHRVILSACSPFFMNVLKRNNHSHPMIYMRGLQTQNLLAIMDFIYHGEANIFQDNLDQFLALAKELELRGLTGTTEDEVVQKISKIDKVEMVNLQHNPIDEINPLSKIQMKEEVLGTMAIKDIGTSKYFESINTLHGPVTTMMYKTEGSSEWTCSVCGKSSKTKNNIRQHIEANHIDGVAHPCDQCEKVSRYIKAYFEKSEINNFVSDRMIASESTNGATTNFDFLG